MIKNEPECNCYEYIKVTVRNIRLLALYACAQNMIFTAK